MNPWLFLAGQVLTIGFFIRILRKKYGGAWPSDVLMVIIGSFAWPLSVTAWFLWVTSQKIEKNVNL